MTRRSGLGLAIGGLAAIALAGTTLAFTGPTNGSFETGTYVDGGSGFEQLNAGDTSITGWTVDAGSVDWVGTYWPAQDGSMSIDMSGVDAGTISQTLATTIGNTYTVSFFLSGNPAGPPTVKTLDVSATGGAAASYTYDVIWERSHQHELDAGDVHVPGDEREHDAQLRQHDGGRVRPGHRQRRHHRNGPHEIRLQGRRLAGDDRQRRQPFQEPGRLRQLLRDRQARTWARYRQSSPRTATPRRQATQSTSQVKHSTKGHHQATVQHANRQSGAKDKPNEPSRPSSRIAQSK